MIGETIAHYSITEKIGAGGMGEVWRATDTKLGRDVALKIIPDLFAQDAERMARFGREAQVLASLNHPNIAAIYGTEEAGGKRALVLEMVEGDDLSERLRSGSIPIEECLDIARQIAEALEAAHDKGVVHRDLKPANVKLTPDGAVKVLDFGLAKALEGDPGAAASDPSQSLSPTLTQAATKAGVILGTAAYMSPEQAKGKTVDRRTDIFSFGVVLFEMLARKKTFEGDSISDTLASVLKLDPPWEALPAGTPQPVLELLHRCLEKDPKQRLQSIGEARIALTTVVRGSTASMAAASSMVGTGAGVESAGVAGAKAGPGMMAWAASLLVVALIAGAVAWLFKPATDGLPPRRYAISPPDLDASYRNQPVISPDGLRVAYLADGKLWVRDLDKLEPHLMQDSDGARAFSWSPDGASLAYVSGNNLYRVAAVGGPPSVITEISFGRVDATAWAPGDIIYIAPGSGPMYSVPAQGGDPREAIPLAPEGESDFHTPSALPGGLGLLYTVHRIGGADTIEAWRDGQRKILLRLEGDRIEDASYATGGYLVYYRRTRNDGVWAVPFSAERLETIGEPFLLDPEGSYPSVAADGTMVYTLGGGATLRQLIWVDRQGQILGTIGQPQEDLIFPELSPDGARVLVSVNPGENRDIWIVDVERGTRTRATFGDDSEWSGVWLPGGERILYSSGLGPTNETFSRAADGTDEPVRVGKFHLPSFREGASLGVASLSSQETQTDLVVVPVEGDGGEPRPFLVAEGIQSTAQLSPDGAWVVYSSDESGEGEIYLKKFPGGEGKWQVSLNGGRYPRWRRDGGELYYLAQGEGENTLMMVKVTTNPTLRLSTPEALFDDTAAEGLSLGLGFRGYDVHPDGERFLTLQSVGQDRDTEPKLAVTQNWLGVWGR